MTTHELKTWPEPFQAVWRGEKVCEIRKDDRGYQVGDALMLYEWNPETREYSGNRIRAEVTHIARGFGLPADMCVMSIAPELKNLRTIAVELAEAMEIIGRESQCKNTRTYACDSLYAARKAGLLK